MKALIISDIHANLTALEAVLYDAKDYDSVWCLGDLVGYGPDPNECIATVSQLPNLICLLGNHDAAVLDKIDITSFNVEARIAIHWSQQYLSAASRAFLAQLPETAQVVGNATLAHGSPRHPIWEYLLDAHSVSENFEFFEPPFCFTGHTHLPVIYHQDHPHPLARRIVPTPGLQVVLTPRMIVNPGSVGQPRDRNPDAAYALFDTETNLLIFRRVPYDIAAVQARMLAAELPQRHINRLDLGW